MGVSGDDERANDRRQDRLPTFQTLATFFDTVQARTSSDDSAMERMPLGWPYMSKVDSLVAV